MHRLSRLPLLAVMAGLLLATGSMAFQPGERPQVADLSAVPAWGLPATALAPADRVVAESRLDAFARATGTHWSALEYAPASLSPGLAVGSGLDLGLAISDAGSAEAAARAFVSRNADLLGTDGARLESARVHAGLGKWSVQWPETVNGMEVLHSRVIVLLTGSGRVAAFGSTTYPSIASAPAPRILEADALRFARSHLEGLGLLDPAAKLTRAEVHGPFVLPVATGVNGRDVSGHTIFRASITAQDPPAAYEVDVDAVNGEILQRTDVLRYDFSGTATGSIDNPNWCAGPADWAVPHLFVTVTGAGTDTCDASGHFSIPFSGSQPETLKAEMKGSFCDIFNTNGSQAFYSAVIEPGVPAEGGRPASWFQSVPLVKLTGAVPQEVEVRGARGALALSTRPSKEMDLIVAPSAEVDRVKLAGAGLVFVGYGITAPEHGWDDYRGADVRGKVVVILNFNPPFAGEGVRLWYGRWDYKYENAARHGAAGDVAERLAAVVGETAARGGRVIIPAFALGRTQEIVFNLHQLREAGKIPDIPVYVDSPLAMNATSVFRLHPECFDAETNEHVARHEDPFGFSRLTYVRSAGDSRALNARRDPMVIISASGMCEAGRVLHHLRHGIGDERNTILLVSWQAPHTLGRRLEDGDERVRILGEEHVRRARVEKIDGFSAHADREGLIEWVESIRTRPASIYLVHGEDEPAEAFAALLGERGFGPVTIPRANTPYPL